MKRFKLILTHIHVSTFRHLLIHWQTWIVIAAFWVDFNEFYRHTHELHVTEIVPPAIAAADCFRDVWNEIIRPIIFGTEV